MLNPKPSLTPHRAKSDRRLGEILQDRQKISAEALHAALKSRARAAVPLGTALAREGVVSQAAVSDALAEQSGMVRVDLDRHPPLPRLSADLDPRDLLRLGALPWRRVAGRIVCVVADPQTAESVRRLLETRDQGVTIALAERTQIEAHIARLHRPALVQAARDRCPEDLSCRTWASQAWKIRPWALLACLASVIASFPSAFILGLMAWVVTFNAATTALRLYALFVSAPRRRKVVAPARKAVTSRQPVISVLVPLYQEDLTLRHLLEAIGQSTYPKALMDIVFVLEEDDIATPLALAQIGLPPWARVVTVPDDTLKTKPRAMNYALDFCRGSIVGIYDAEDRPEPEQLAKIAEHLASAPPEVGAVQGYLDFYNARQNWLARCFTIEYAIWFRVLLRGLQALRAPIPLGGTTVFFRRDVLEAVGAWDAHNVTEDADLGFRLARFGYRTEMVATTTMEEANCDPRAWVPQRSRWLKGYAMTWATHMRRPRALLADLGWGGFLTFQILLLGGLTAYLAAPVFWVLWLGWLGVEMAVFQAAHPLVWMGVFGSLLLGQVVMLLVALRAVAARPRVHLLPWVMTLPLYWPLGALAAYRAVTEMFTKPFHWAKTKHGL